MSTPVTPCAPDVTVAFVERRFGPEVAKTLDPTGRLGARRARRIAELRRCRDFRDAERFGWLSLTAWLLGMKATMIDRLDPSSGAILHRARSGDVLPDPLGDNPEPTLVEVGATGLRTSDPRDALGYHVVELAATALRDGMVAVDGRRVAGGAVAASLRRRLEAVGGG